MKALILIILFTAGTQGFAQSSYSAANQGNEENKETQLDTGYVNKDIEKTPKEVKAKSGRKAKKKSKSP